MSRRGRDALLVWSAAALIGSEALLVPDRSRDRGHSRVSTVRHALKGGKITWSKSIAPWNKPGAAPPGGSASKSSDTSTASLYSASASWQRQLSRSSKGIQHDTVTLRQRNGRILPIPQQKRYRSREWLGNLWGIPLSATLKRIRSPVVGITLWSALVVVVYAKLGLLRTTGPDPTTVPHALLGSTLGLLLTFRTNAAYTRFWEGRTIWQGVVDRCRDLARMSSAYSGAIGQDKYRRICNLIAIFPLMLEYHLEGRRGPSRFLQEEISFEEKLEGSATVDDFRSLPRKDRQLARHYAFKAIGTVNGGARGNDTAAKATTTAVAATRLSSPPWLVSWVSRSAKKRRDESSYSNTSGDAEPLFFEAEPLDIEPTGNISSRASSAREFEQFMPTAGLDECANRPLFVSNALVLELQAVPDSADGLFTNRERLALIEKVNALASAIGACERLVQTPVPLSYARHTSRFLSLWCLTLPLVLAPKLQLFTPGVMALASWGLFGIQEIGLWIEDPFRGLLKLSVLSDTIFCDVSETANMFARAQRERDLREKKASEQPPEKSKTNEFSEEVSPALKSQPSGVFRPPI